MTDDDEYENTYRGSGGIWVSIVVCLAVAGGIALLVVLDRKTRTDSPEAEVVVKSTEPNLVSADNDDPFATGPSSPQEGTPSGTLGTDKAPEPSKPAPKPRPATVIKDIEIPLFSGKRPLGHAGILTGTKVQFLSDEPEGKARILYVGTEYTVPADSLVVDLPERPK